MKTLIPKTNPELLTFAGVAAIGAGQYGAVIPLLQNTNGNISADIQPLVDAIMAHGQGRTEMKTRRDTLKSVIDNSRVLLMLGRDSLKPQFGKFFNESWLPFGHNASLEVTDDPAQLLTLLRGYKQVLDDQPAYELPTKDFTALHVQTLLAQLEQALGDVSLQETVLGILMGTRDVKADKLRKRMRGLMEELNQSIDPLDQRWKAFGLNMPGASETPDVPENVSVVLLGASAAAVKWGASPRADHYRVWMKVHDTEGEPTAMGSPGDIDFTLENLPPNTALDVAVSAVNNGGESQLSEVVTITTHPA